MNEIYFIIYYIFVNDDNPFICNYVGINGYFTLEYLLEEIKCILNME